MLCVVGIWGGPEFFDVGCNFFFRVLTIIAVGEQGCPSIDRPIRRGDINTAAAMVVLYRSATCEIWLEYVGRLINGRLNKQRLL